MAVVIYKVSETFRCFDSIFLKKIPFISSGNGVLTVEVKLLLIEEISFVLYNHIKLYFPSAFIL